MNRKLITIILWLIIIFIMAYKGYDPITGYLAIIYYGSFGWLIANHTIDLYKEYKK